MWNRHHMLHINTVDITECCVLLFSSTIAIGTPFPIESCSVIYKLLSVRGGGRCLFSGIPASRSIRRHISIQMKSLFIQFFMFFMYRIVLMNLYIYYCSLSTVVISTHTVTKEKWHIYTYKYRNLDIPSLYFPQIFISLVHSQHPRLPWSMYKFKGEMLPKKAFGSSL